MYQKKKTKIVQTQMENSLEPKICLDPIFFRTQNLFGLKIVLDSDFFDQKIFLPKIF